VFGTSSAGEFFVEAALFAEIFHCDAVATEPSRVRIYPKAAVLKALATDPSSALPFLKLMAHQVIEARQRLELMKIRSAKDRVMLYLDLHAGAEGSVRLKSSFRISPANSVLRAKHFIARSRALNMRAPLNVRAIVSSSKEHSGRNHSGGLKTGVA
jgi:CRP-like cAMP-binding protein